MVKMATQPTQARTSSQSEGESRKWLIWEGGTPVQSSNCVLETDIPLLVGGVRASCQRHESREIGEGTDSSGYGTTPLL